MFDLDNLISGENLKNSRNYLNKYIVDMLNITEKNNSYLNPDFLW